MTTGDWLITSLGAATALAGLALLAWALLADRLRTRHARREGSLRRCPRCWYDMSATEGLTCPECGKTAKHERRLGRARRRWRPGVAAVAVLSLGLGMLAWQHVPVSFWIHRLPDSVLIECIPYAGKRDWAARELFRRNFSGFPAPQVERPNELSRRQRDRLTTACIRAIEHWQGRGDTIAWPLLSSAASHPELAYQAAMDRLDSPDVSTCFRAYSHLEFIAPRLDRTQLTAARDAFRAIQKGSNARAPEYAESGATSMEAALRALDDDLYKRQVREAQAVPLTPDEIVATLHNCTTAQAAVLYDRLGLLRPSFAAGAFSTDPRMELWRRDMFVDADDQLDRVLELKHVDADAGALLIFRQRRGGWQFLGCIEAPAWSSSPVQPETIDADDGTRWLRLSDSGFRWGGSQEVRITQESWYRYISGRLQLTQWITTNSEILDLHDHRLSAEFVSVETIGARHYGAYEVHASAALPVFVDASEETRTMGAESGRFLFPLDREPPGFDEDDWMWNVTSSRYGRHRGEGPWQGRRYNWLLEHLDERFVERFLPDLLTTAARADEHTLGALRELVLSLPATDAVQQLQEALDEQDADPPPP
jgi:hypothetical protein